MIKIRGNYKKPQVVHLFFNFASILLKTNFWLTKILKLNKITKLSSYIPLPNF